ncbi:hypothetical protein [Streptomyces niveus]|uniref:hypothetical protein n=1 Tax=Streptomyces niveus TaxID=193462 RepID=UPI0003C5C8CF|nr:hypothetical protein M877_04565 [Streptomyces niveus NCIMB 11891]
MDSVTMDGLAERAGLGWAGLGWAGLGWAGLGEGTVFCRFGTRAGVFRALLDAEERRFQDQAQSGPPPLGLGTDPLARLVAYGRARIVFLLDHHAIAGAALDRN